VNLTRIGLGLAATLAVAFPQQPSAGLAGFDVASIRRASSCGDGRSGPRLGISTSPGRLSIKCQTVDFLIRQAYLSDGRDGLFVGGWLFMQPIKGGPPWITSALYDIEARVGAFQNREAMLGPMMRVLLEDRFKLRTHHETREVSIYEMTAAKGGPKLPPAIEASCVPVDVEKFDPQPGTHACGIPIRSLKSPGPALTFYHATLGDLCRGISQSLGLEVVDKTGISGVFDFRLEMSVEDLFPGTRGRAAISPDDPPMPSIFDAIQKLGLRLERAKGSRSFLVIDHVELPSDN
jgi:uncharacterized protein (TIGR03435 family)